ncbi:hypothetical protein J4526_04915 [Desulfurococcaceae archaeon MEX13E-LK6-19]|nr:hypothetical protein J4526_04915 [Desulfurococcaceae archaeon MEX13E-LK6-19]
MIKEVRGRKIKQQWVMALKKNKHYIASLVIGLVVIALIAINPPFSAGKYSSFYFSIKDDKSVDVVRVFLDYVVFYNNKTVTELGNKSLAFYIEYNGTRYFLAAVKPVYLEPIFVEKEIYVIAGKGQKTTIKLLHNITGTLIGPFPIGTPDLFFGGELPYVFRWPIGKYGGPEFAAELKLKTYIKDTIGIMLNNTGNGKVDVYLRIIYDKGDYDEITLDIDSNTSYVKYININGDKLVEDIRIEQAYVYINGLKYSLNVSSGELLFYIRDNPGAAVVMLIGGIFTPIVIHEVNTRYNIIDSLKNKIKKKTARKHSKYKRKRKRI